MGDIGAAGVLGLEPKIDTSRFNLGKRGPTLGTGSTLPFLFVFPVAGAAFGSELPFHHAEMLAIKREGIPTSHAKAFFIHA